MTSGPTALASLLPKLAGPAFSKRGFADGTLLARWGDIVGPAVAAHSVPLAISRPRQKDGEAVLKIRVDSGAWAIEIQHLAPLILERVNGTFGFRAIGRLSIQQGPLSGGKAAGGKAAGRKAARRPPAPRPLREEERRAVRDRVGVVDDLSLREALEALGSAILSRKA